MSVLKISPNISQAESTALQLEVASKGSWTLDSESYVSPDRESRLVFQLKEEIPFGPKLFRAFLDIPGGQRVELSNPAGSRLFLSPGKYGQGYDHWDGDPWSPDSSRIALFDFRKRGSNGLGGANIYEISSRKWRRIAETVGMLSHHMWSPQGGWYLFRDLTQWWILSVQSGEVNVLADVKRYPRHAYFLSEKRVLVAEETLRLISLPMLELLAEENLASIERNTSDRYSLLDPTRKRVLIGVGTSIRDVVVCDNWYAVEGTEAD